MATLKDDLKNPNLTPQQRAWLVFKYYPELEEWANNKPPDVSMEEWVPHVRQAVGSILQENSTSPEQAGFFESLRSGYQQGAGSIYKTLANTAGLVGADSLKQHFLGEQAYRDSTVNPQAGGVGQFIGQSIGQSPKVTIPVAAALPAAGFAAGAGLPSAVAAGALPIMAGITGAIGSADEGAGAAAKSFGIDASLASLPFLAGALKNVGGLKGLFGMLKNSLPKGTKIGDLYNAAVKGQLPSAAPVAAAETAPAPARDLLLDFFPQRPVKAEDFIPTKAAKTPVWNKNLKKGAAPAAKPTATSTPTPTSASAPIPAPIPQERVFLRPGEFFPPRATMMGLPDEPFNPAALAEISQRDQFRALVNRLLGVE